MRDILGFLLASRLHRCSLLFPFPVADLAMDTAAGAQAPPSQQLHHHTDDVAAHHQPQQQQQSLPLQQQHHQQDAATAAAYPPQYASSQPAHHEHQAPQSNQFLEPDTAVAGRFTEEWDASQRGSSILDHHGATTAMERSASVHSYAAGDDQNLPFRNNTLKKKGSVRRTSSRRSTRAGSVRSLAMNSSAADPEDAHSAFYCPVPTSGTPTNVLAERFQSKL